MGRRTRPVPDPAIDGEYPLPVIAGLLDRSPRAVCYWVEEGALTARRALVDGREMRVAKLVDAKELDVVRRRNGVHRPEDRPRRARGHRPQQTGIDGLTDRQRDCVRAVCELGSAALAAPVLGIVPASVRFVLRVVYSKIGLYRPDDRRTPSLPRACLMLGRWDAAHGVEPGWFTDDEGEIGDD